MRLLERRFSVPRSERWRSESMGNSWSAGHMERQRRAAGGEVKG